jgi:TRAP-type C4-dicarboxylate transport system permease small subunit
MLPEPAGAAPPRLLAIADRAVMAFVALLTATFFVCVLLQVFVRYVLEQPLPWTDEVARYCFVWASFLAAAVIVGRGEHFNIDFMLEALPHRARSLLRLLGTALCIGFALILVVYGYRWSARLMFARSSVLELPQGLIYAVVPISAAYMALHLVLQLVGQFRALGRRPAGDPSC